MVDVQCSLNFSDIIIKTFSQNRNQEETEKIRSQRSTMLIWATMVIVLNKATFWSIIQKNGIFSRVSYLKSFVYTYCIAEHWSFFTCKHRCCFNNIKLRNSCIQLNITNLSIAFLKKVFERQYPICDKLIWYFIQISKNRIWAHGLNSSTSNLYSYIHLWTPVWRPSKEFGIYKISGC